MQKKNPGIINNVAESHKSVIQTRHVSVYLLRAQIKPTESIDCFPPAVPVAEGVVLRILCVYVYVYNGVMYVIISGGFVCVPWISVRSNLVRKPRFQVVQRALGSV